MRDDTPYDQPMDDPPDGCWYWWRLSPDAEWQPAWLEGDALWVHSVYGVEVLTPVPIGEWVGPLEPGQIPALTNNTPPPSGGG